MPWSARDAHKHNHAIQPGSKAADQWSHVSNSVLERTGDEGLAIREANGVAGRGQHHLGKERLANRVPLRTHRGRFGG